MENLLDKASVRYELYTVVGEIQERKNHHLQAWGMKHELPCHVCDRADAQKAGVKFAIRHFGGKPRY